MLITAGVHKSLDSIMQYIGIDEQHKQLSNIRYEGILLSACASKLNAMSKCEERLKCLPVVTAVRYLLNNRNTENDATIKFLLDPRRCSNG